MLPGTPSRTTRTCAGCHRRAEAVELLRIRWAGDELLTGKGPGRGVWLCAGRSECFDQAVRSGRLSRTLRVPVPAAALTRLRGRLFS